MKTGIRKSVLAGAWYPGDPKSLRSEIQKYLDRVPETGKNGKPLSIISPHAGYIYSGQVAAYAYKLLVGQSWDTVIVAGPSHRVFFRGASVWAGSGYETPLGTVPVDEDLTEGLLKEKGLVTSSPETQIAEHSIEIQLPFLQTVLGDFKFVPIVLGSGMQMEENCVRLANLILKSRGKKDVLFVGSSDLSHFHSYDRAVRMDSETIPYIEKLDYSGFLGLVDSGSSEACGAAAIALAMTFSRGLGAVSGRVLRYANSGDVTGDRSDVVGYLSAAVFSG